MSMYPYLILATRCQFARWLSVEVLQNEEWGLVMWQQAMGANSICASCISSNQLVGPCSGGDTSASSLGVAPISLAAASHTVLELDDDTTSVSSEASVGLVGTEGATAHMASVPNCAVVIDSRARSGDSGTSSSGGGGATSVASDSGGSTTPAVSLTVADCTVVADGGEVSSHIMGHHRAAPPTRSSSSSSSSSSRPSRSASRRNRGRQGKLSRSRSSSWSRHSSRSTSRSSRRNRGRFNRSRSSSRSRRSSRSTSRRSRRNRGRNNRSRSSSRSRHSSRSTSRNASRRNRGRQDRLSRSRSVSHDGSHDGATGFVAGQKRRRSHSPSTSPATHRQRLRRSFFSSSFLEVSNLAAHSATIAFVESRAARAAVPNVTGSAPQWRAGAMQVHATANFSTKVSHD